MIASFDKEYSFLSNFYTSKIEYEGLTFLNTEAAFHAQKTLDLTERKEFTMLNPSEAKKKGRRLLLRKDWEEVKDEIMYEINMAKFTQNIDLKKKLLDTNEEELIEGNWWHDNYWGDCSCDKCKEIKGRNTLGNILMRIRKELKK